MWDPEAGTVFSGVEPVGCETASEHCSEHYTDTLNALQCDVSTAASYSQFILLPPTVLLFKVVNITTPQGHSNTVLSDTASEIWQLKLLLLPGGFTQNY